MDWLYEGYLAWKRYELIIHFNYSIIPVQQSHLVGSLNDFLKFVKLLFFARILPIDVSWNFLDSFSCPYKICKVTEGNLALSHAETSTITRKIYDTRLVGFSAWDFLACHCFTHITPKSNLLLCQYLLLVWNCHLFISKVQNKEPDISQDRLHGQVDRASDL